MPDPWSDFDDRWREGDGRQRQGRDRRAAQRARTVRRRIAAVVVLVLLAGAGVLVATSTGGGGGTRARLAPVTTVGVPATDTTPDTATTTPTPPTTTTTAPKQPLTPAQQRVAAENKAVAHFLKHSWFIVQGGKRKREMALTFDDGPGPDTERIMRILRRTHTPATFFQIGSQIPTFKSVVKQQLRDGFVLGDHTEAHMPLAGKPRSVQRQQITDMAAQMEKIGGPAPVLFRPPTGVWDRTTRQLLKRKGMLAVFWTIDTSDYERPGTQQIVRAVLGGAQPGAIVLMHDGGGNRSQTVAALPAIIKGLKKRGYRLVTIPTLVKDAPPKKRKPAPFGSGPGL